MNSDLEVIDAFVDGERVDPDQLKTALSGADGRDYFVDVWRLRDAVQQERDLTVEPRAPQKTAAAPPRRSRAWLTAAALVVGVAGGYVAGQRMPPPTPPTPASTSVPAVAAAPARSSFPAPAPTRVIQLELQPDTTRTGGN